MAETKKSMIARIKAIFAGEDTPPPEDGNGEKTKDGSNVVNYSVEGSDAAVYVDISNDEVPGIDVGDEVFSDEALTTPYPDGTFTVTGTEFSFTVVSGAVTEITDVNGTGAGTPNAVSAPVTPDMPPADPISGGSDFAAVVRATFDDDKGAEGAAYKKLIDSFATGTPEERIANLETVCKALMEYSFGWKIAEAQRKATEDAAIAVYNNDLKGVQTLAAKHEKILPDLLAVVEQMAEVEQTDPLTLTGAKKERFERTNKREKTIQRIAENVAAIKAGKA